MIPDKDYSSMEFNPLIKRKLLTEYPKLSQIIGERDDKMIRYVLLMYDQNSPLRKYYPDVNKRKDFAAAIAGYDADKDISKIENLKTLTENVTTEDGQKVVPYEDLLESISTYMTYQNSRLWTMIVTNEQSFYEYQRRIMAEVGGEADKDALSAITIKTKLLEAMDDIHKRLDRYYSELTGGDQDLEMAIMIKKRLSPESKAVR